MPTPRCKIKVFAPPPTRKGQNTQKNPARQKQKRPIQPNTTGPRRESAMQYPKNIKKTKQPKLKPGGPTHPKNQKNTPEAQHKPKKPKTPKTPKKTQNPKTKESRRESAI